MSIEAMSWALNTDVGDSTRKLVLIGRANHAHKDGRNSYPSNETLAEYANCSVKTISRHTRQLVTDGFIRRGDQEQVAHLRKDRRPVVYDIAMDETTRAQWAAEQAERTEEDTDERGDNLSPRGGGTTGHGSDPSSVDHGGTDGGTPVSSRGDKAVSPEPSLTEELPLSPDSGQRPRLQVTCQKHGTKTHDNCRGCGTTARQLQERAERDAADKRRSDHRQASAQSRATTGAGAPIDLLTAAREAFAVAKDARKAAGGTR